MILADWVVDEVKSDEPIADVPGFREIVVAYYERKPLNLAAFRDAIYQNNVQVLVDFFAADEAAYRCLHDKEKVKPYVQI